MRFADCGRADLAAIFLGFFLLTGCAAKSVAPKLSDAEANRVRESFIELAQRLQGCSSFEADATVKVTAMLQDGGLSGFLLAGEPAAVKFVGLNPFGQPVLVIASNGEEFTLVSVPEEKVWRGPVTADRVTVHLPDGLSFGEIYDLVIGRLPADCRDGIDVRREPDTVWYTLTARCPGLGLAREITFDPDRALISGMSLLDRKHGDPVLNIAYGSHENNTCRLPTHIIIEEAKPTGMTVELKLASVDTSVKLTPADFTQKAPAGFERINLE